METREITLSKGIADGIQQIQMILTRGYGKNVSFTATLNYLLLKELSDWATNETEMSYEEVEEWKAHWTAGLDPTTILAFRDSITHCQKTTDATHSTKNEN